MIIFLTMSSSSYFTPQLGSIPATVIILIEPPPPPCKYGHACKRTNPEHFLKYTHPICTIDIPCKYGINCYRTDEQHLKKYVHPDIRILPCKGGCNCGQLTRHVLHANSGYESPWWRSDHV